MRIINVNVINEKSAAKCNNVFLKNFNDHFNELNNQVNNFLRKLNYSQEFKRNYECY